MDRITLLRGILDQRGLGSSVTESQLLETLRTVPRRPAPRISPRFDDRRDYRVELLLLRPDQRQRLGLPAAPPAPPPPPLTGSVVAFAIPQPVLRIRLHALVCRNSDGKYADSGKPQTHAEVGQALAKIVPHINTIYASTGIEFVFYPSADVEILNDTKLNQDFIVPAADRPKLTQSPPLSDAEMQNLVDNVWTTYPYRAGFAKKYPGKLVLLFAEGTTYSLGVPPTQANWRYCKKCQGLLHGGAAGVCPAGGGHDAAGSGDYALTFMHDETAANIQDNWRWCKKCSGLFFAGKGAGVCPATGGHDPSSSGDYVLTFAHGDTDPNLQANWRYCSKCQGLAFAGSSTGKCPATGAHSFTGSGDYTLRFNQPQAPRWVITSPSGGGFSSGESDFAKLGGYVPADNPYATATFLAHEIGHFLHLPHTFVQYGLSAAEAAPFKLDQLSGGDLKLARLAAADAIRKKIVADFEKAKAAGVAAGQLVKHVLDGDGWLLDDTPPDDSGELLYYLNAAENGGDACAALDTVSFKLKDGTAISYKPDRSLVMSYFKHCTNFAQHFSFKQGEVMRNMLMNGNRRRLVAAQLGDTATPGLAYDGVWNPGTAGQFVSWGKSLAQHNALYNEWWGKGYRLVSQQAYVYKGALLYDGVWTPSTANQFVSWAKTREQHNALYNEWWNKNFRLIHQQAYVVNGQLLYDGVWTPNTGGQFVSWGKTREQHNALYNEWWGKNFRLIHQQAYVFGNQLLYDGIWNPSTAGQFVSWGKSLTQHNALYNEWWGKSFRLMHQQSYAAGGQVLYDGVWTPSTANQFVSWWKTREQLAAQYDELWQQNLRLVNTGCRVS